MVNPPRRSSARRIAIFNHKGGVGKTTLTANIANAMAELKRRVLVVDADPQCNLTSYLVDPDVVDDLLDNSESAKGGTIWSALKPVVEGSGDVKLVAPIELPTAGAYLLPGDIRLSDFESELNEFWSQALVRKVRGYKGTSAISELVNQICATYEIDYVFYDCGPNIGPLNRIILLDCDFFIVTAACDLFSVRALKTLGRTLSSWVQDWRTISGMAPEQTYVLPGRPKFLGYIPQRFRVYGPHIAKQDAKYLGELHRAAHSEIALVLRSVDRSLAPFASDLRIGEVRDLHTMVNASQRQSQPISRTRGVNTARRDAAARNFRTLASVIARRAATLV